MRLDPFEVCDLLKDYLNAQSFQFAQPNFVVDIPITIDLEELKSLRCSITPRTADSSQINRKSFDDILTVDIAVQQHVGNDKMNLTRQLSKFCEEIKHSVFLSKWPEYGIGFEAHNRDPIYAQDHMDGANVFTSVITVEYVVCDYSPTPKTALIGYSVVGGEDVIG